jgi:mannose-6-phosphate isomerase-like protein (cupin superfamily)
MSDHGLPVQPPLPPGARGEILEGDPKSDGIFTMRLQFPPDYVLAPHTHPADERVTVLSGEVFVGIGDSLDRASAQAFTSGCFYVNPAGLHHYVFSGKQGAVLQLTCKGPWGIHFLEQKKE